MQVIQNRLEKEVESQGCEFLQLTIDEVETDLPNITENVSYFDCTMIVATGKCPYPARHCGFKDQVEEFINWAQNAIRG